MVALTSTHPSACPACDAAPLAQALARPELETADITLSVPAIHCAACIATVEAALNERSDVAAARVNLTLKRVRIETNGASDPDALIDTLKTVGFDAFELDAGALSATETDQAGRDLLMRLAVAGFASMNVMLLSVSVWSGAEDATRDMFHWISAAIAMPSIAFAGQPFFYNAWRALSARRLNMDVPIVLAIVLAVVTSLWETSLSGEHAYFDAALTLVFFLLAGRYLDHRTRSAARSAAEELAALEVPRAIRVGPQGGEQVAVAELVVGDLIQVVPGGRMPVDGIVVEGHSDLDRSLLTGETLPTFVRPGQNVSAGEVNLTGALGIRATAVGKDSSLYRMADLVAVAESGRSRYTSLADAAAKLYAPGVHILSALSFLGWWLYSGDLRTALNIAAAVLIITCPCALGLAVPAVTTAASGRLFRQGLLIKNATALERLAAVDTVVFDKTGTLTTGALKLSNLGGQSDIQMQIALGLAQMSGHPLSKALAQALVDKGVEPAQISELTEVAGQGVQGLFQGHPVQLGRADWVGALQGQETATWLKVGDASPVAFTFTDTVRAGARALVAHLQDAGCRVALVSGDADAPVSSMAQELGILEWSAQVLPEDKAFFVNGLTEEGHKVLMVGDGLNDTVALAAAHVSISPASALDAARVASDIVMLGQDLEPIGAALQTSKQAVKRIKENFRIATVYNIVAVPLAVAGMATPLIAALAMSSSSLTVSLNALRVR